MCKSNSSRRTQNEIKYIHISALLELNQNVIETFRRLIEEKAKQLIKSLNKTRTRTKQTAFET